MLKAFTKIVLSGLPAVADSCHIRGAIQISAKPVSAKKTRIFNAALRLFAIRGVENVSMRDIGDEVGLQVAAIYNHYKAKEELVNECYDLFLSHYNDERLDKNEWRRVLKGGNAKEIINTARFMFLHDVDENVRLAALMTGNRVTIDEKAGAVYSEVLSRAMLNYCEYFNEGINLGTFMEFDAAALAAMYVCVTACTHQLNNANAEAASRWTPLEERIYKLMADILPFVDGGLGVNRCKQVDALKNGNGVQSLLNGAYRIFENPILFHDTFYKLRAYTDVPCDDIIWQEFITTDTVSAETHKFFVQEKITEQISKMDMASLLTSGKLKYNRLVANIYNAENINVGFIAMVESNHPFGEDDKDAFERLAAKISQEVKCDAAYTAHGRAFHEYVIKKLLNGEIDDPELYVAHMQILFDGFGGIVNMAIIDISRSTARDTVGLAHLRNSLELRFKTAKFAYYDGYIVMIISANHLSIQCPAFMDSFTPFIEKHNLFVGVSADFENLFELRTYYDQVLETLRSTEKSGEQRVFVCSDLT
jgi:AcrR family transcriptional regulator